MTRGESSHVAARLAPPRLTWSFLRTLALTLAMRIDDMGSFMVMVRGRARTALTVGRVSA